MGGEVSSGRVTVTAENREELLIWVKTHPLPGLAGGSRVVRHAIAL